MPLEINFTDEDIEYAENILLPKGMSFDAERRAFIENLETIDLHAVPGSGKTTALLAKLLILAKYLPFKNNSGILVLSHTNSAVDEIHSEIAKHCPHLFNYPNYVGTIQGFVNKFLAKPCYVNFFKKKPISIDNESYNERILKYKLPYTANISMNRKKDPSSYFESIRLNNKSMLVKGISGTPEKFDLKNQDTPTYKALLKMKYDVLESGYLHYDDAYYLAGQYLNDYVINILQNRFSHIFVDEMQDMDKHQHDLLEEIFFTSNKNKSIFQRIGDKNQSIYNGNVKLDSIWSERKNTLNLNGSHRLTEKISNLVNCFALDRANGFQINGLRTGDISPYLIVYDDRTIEQVIPVFSGIIKELIEKDMIPKNGGKYKAISWIKDHDNHIALSDYCPDFSVNGHSNKSEYSTLTDYVYYSDIKTNSLKPIYKNIVGILLKILRLENIFDAESNNHFTKTSLFNYLFINNRSYNDLLKSSLYAWSINIAREKQNETIELIREHIPILLGIFNRSISDSNDFIYTDGTEIVAKNTPRNIINIHGFDIEVSTIHAAKGQTHTGTLYLESYYQGGYETDKLSKQFCGVNFNDNRTYHKQSTKMAYVGLSRSTHLLCVALHRERYDAMSESLDESKWEVKVI